LEGCPEYNIVAASSGADAIELVKKIDFALILLDVQMADLDGFETAASIKRLPGGKDVPIMMVTAIHDETSYVLKGYSVGAIDYIARPFHPDIFKAKVGVYANLQIKQRQIAVQTKYLLEAHKALHLANRATTLLETMPVGVIVADPAGRISQINREAKRIWGDEPMVTLSDYKQLVGWWPDRGEPVKPHEWPLVRAVEQRETSLYEIVNIRARDGTIRTILDSAAPIQGIPGNVTGAADVMLDITHSKRLQEALHLS